METTAVDGSDKKPNMSGLLIFLLVIALALSSGCIDKQEGVKIDLGRTEEWVVQVSENDTDVVYFGFDLWSSPKETLEYETTQDDLGCGITQFAAPGALSHIKAHDVGGAIGLARGLNAGNLTDWDKTEMPCGFVETDDSDYAELRAPATRYGMVEQGVVE